MTEQTSPDGVKAGWHIWLVGIIGVLWNGFGCVDFTMTVTKNEAYLAGYPQEMLDYWFAMPWWVFGVWAVGVFGALLGSIALLMKREAAVTLFAAAFIASIISVVTDVMDKNAPKMEGQEFFPWLIMGLGFVFLAYAFWQMKRGVLR
ncbi:MAG: hypothetical protein FP825_02235 [Hyphomonas sp.]|uniref:hypothetical protein n=1 Tax=Hyphomonas sp. TaxID=87 RepID=UPI0017E28464|nr:hypothetical protein [Hyphomonas sp.]MBA3067283.1 hypothetical protein [Hyphomonas sp.]MBU3920310.1 hypothetical protein [Alphaproteobacteria bacterium]MBU4061505.1 hypothetical protein [Alphaproteobacteria bacterium]MBU4163247.1 hypothetical protein [Alphaproteobacteria bacterium]